MFEKQEKVVIKRQCPACSSSICEPVAPHWFKKSGNKSVLTSPFSSKYRIVSEDKEWELIREQVTCASCGCLYERAFEVRPNRQKDVPKVEPKVDENE